MTAEPGLPAPRGARLTLLTLGGWSLVWTAKGVQTPTPLIGASKPLALVAYLALTPEKTAHREHLLDLLWADLDIEAARHALRQTTWYLRRRVGVEVLRSEGEQLALAVPVDTDRDAFLAAVEARELERALALYAGEFLPAYAAPGGAEFERWADVERDRLRGTFLRVAEALVRRRLDGGRTREAVALARRIRGADRLSERGWRILLEALVAANDPVGASVEADALERLLVDEDRRPEPATRTILGVARAAATERSARPAAARTEGTGPSSASLVAELVGRAEEFSAILHAWDAAQRGSPARLHVAGPPGLGKTRLLSDAHARLRSTGARAVLLRANPGEAQIPYAFASDLATALSALPGSAAISTAAADTLLALNPTLSATYPAARADGATGEEALRRRTLAVAELVAAVADEAPLALFVDDIHWADPASRQVLGGLANRLHSERVLLVTATRPTPDGPMELPGAATFQLKPLSAIEIGRLVSSLGALPDEPWTTDFAGSLALATGGSPLLVLETLQLLIERKVLALGTDGWTAEDAAALAEPLAEGGALRRRVEQLGRNERWLLLVLAVAGSPVTAAQLLTHGWRGAEGLVADLADLEQRGFVARGGAGWVPAHDETAEVAVSLASPEALRAAHLAVGKAAAAEGDASLLLRAGQHLARAAEADELARVFGRWLLTRRTAGDHRGVRALAAEMLGPSAPSRDVRALAGRVPFLVRWGLYTRPRRIAATAALVLAGAAALVLLLRTPVPLPPEEELAAIERTPDGQGFRVASVPLADDRWLDPRPIDVAVEGRLKPVLVRRTDWSTASVYSMARSAWVVSELTPGRDVHDLLLYDSQARSERLTSGPGDDLDPSWAPDGNAVTFATTRWTGPSEYRIAVVDLATREVRRLTTDDAVERFPRWSIAGLRIAYLRYARGAGAGLRPPELCWTTVEGYRGGCTEPPRGWSFVGLSKWLGSMSIGAMADSAGLRSFVSADLETGAITRIRRNVSVAAASPDGRWALGIVGEADEAAGEWIVFPIARPDQSLPVRWGGRTTGFVLRWGRSRTALPYVTSLVVTEPGGAVPLEAPYQMRARGVTAMGDTVWLPAVRWWSGDTAVAAITESGTLVGRQRGAAWVHVSAGGWREDSIRVAVRSSRTTTVLREAWDGGIEGRWVPFGSPRPAKAAGPGGVEGLLTRGDGAFTSGVYARQAFSAIDGLGAEAAFSSPLTAERWQSLVLLLEGELDSAALARWDHRTGEPPRTQPSDEGPRACAVSVPAGEGPAWTGRIGFAAGQASSSAELPRALAGGAWYRVRIQLFPDGRCGAALDGRPLWLSRRPLAIDRPFRVMLSGSAVGARMLFGGVEVWQGVKGDVDWSGLERRGTVGGAPRARRAP